MFYPRIIPVLLVKEDYLVKSTRFKDYNYIGDPIHAVHIFNELEVDELVFLDIEASKNNRCISIEFVKKIAEESNMPFSVGGGVTTIEQIGALIQAGAEKVVINTAAGKNKNFVRQATDAFGSSSIIVCIDVKKKWLGKEYVYIEAGSKSTAITPVDYALEMERLGAGEIIIQSVDEDGMRTGYNIPLIKSISEQVKIPVIALGGAGNLSHLQAVYKEGYATAMAAGSMFVYQGSRKGVLINYPAKEEIENLFGRL